jgi:7-cyano-7-deazaguanine synthase
VTGAGPTAATSTSAVVAVSGGLDSVTLAHDLAAAGHDLTLVSFDYGQRHVRELGCAAACARRLGATYHAVDLRSVGELLSGSALTDPTVAVPDGHYTDASMQATVVPNRNAILLSVATGVAVAVGAEMVATAVHAGDHPIYPDCRPAFITAFEDLARVANEGFAAPGFRVVAPYLTWDKADIVARGAALGVPFAETWSCYRGGDEHCGRCGTCVERIEAFALAGVADPTRYAAVQT